MNSSSLPFITTRRMNIYEPLQHVNSWMMDCYRDDNCANLSASDLVEIEDKLEDQVEFIEFQSEDNSHGTPTPSNKYAQESSRTFEKKQRRLAQNREAARKSRIRKKAYVQQLESSRIKLAQMEQELHRARQQGLYVGSVVDHLPLSTPMNSGISVFESEYGHWLEDQKRQISELRSALQSDQVTEVELKIMVEMGINHYFDLFRMKASAAKADIFYLMSGMWKSPAERFFFWIGGFRPSELLKVLVPMLEPITEKQQMEVANLTQSCQQAEDALTQGIDRLQQTLSETVAAQPPEGGYIPQMSLAMERLEALVTFVNQADHLRMETLQQMQRILTTRQAARGLLVLGDYFHRLKALSSLWASRPREPA